jgi:hypothetical protein
MIADILTKGLPAWKVKHHTAVLRLHSACGGVVNFVTVNLAGLDQAEAPGEESRLRAGDPKLKSLDTTAIVPPHYHETDI